MLVLTRKIGESIIIDDDVKVTIVQIKGKQVRVGVEAPGETRIHREEVYQSILSENQAALNSVNHASGDFIPVADDGQKTGTDE